MAPKKKPRGKKLSDRTSGGKPSRVTKQARAGLTFSVGRILSQMKKGRYAPRVSPLAAVVLTATIEVK